MSDLSHRIMDVWLKKNPEHIEKGGIHAEWWIKRHQLDVLLHYKAYESAVIQFLVPYRLKNEISMHISPMSVDMGGCNHKAYIGGHKGHGSGRCFAEALLNAIESANK